MNGLTNKEMLLRLMDSVDEIKKINASEHKEISDKIHNIDLNSETFKTKIDTKIKTSVTILGAIYGVILVIAKIIF